MRKKTLKSLHGFKLHWTLTYFSFCVTDCVSIFSFALLVGIPVGVGSYTIELKICVITVGIKKYMSRGGSSPSDWVRRVSSLVQILREKNFNSKTSLWRFSENFCDSVNFNISSWKPKAGSVLLHRCL